MLHVVERQPFTVEDERIFFRHSGNSALPPVDYGIVEGWEVEGRWVALVFQVDRYPTHKGQTCFHMYEGVAHEGQALYSYCLMGNVVLVLPNQRGRTKLFPKVKGLRFPWLAQVPYEPLADDVIWNEVPASVGSRPLQVGA